jgi:hypothetical protein
MDGVLSHCVWRQLRCKGGIDPDLSHTILLTLLAPQQPLGVQVAAVRALAERPSNDLPVLLLPWMCQFEPLVRITTVQVPLSCAERAKAILKAARSNGSLAGIASPLTEPADRVPLMKHPDAEVGKLAQALLIRTYV